jgi:hypothetical protein
LCVYLSFLDCSFNPPNSTNQNELSHVHAAASELDAENQHLTNQIEAIRRHFPAGNTALDRLASTPASPQSKQQQQQRVWLIDLRCMVGLVYDN